MPKTRSITPHSRIFRRGSIGGLVDGRTSMGRLVRRMEAQLVAHIGGSPNVVQRLLIQRMVKVWMQLDLLEAKVGTADWTPTDSRTYGALLNAYRLLAREIGMEGTSPPEKSLDQHRAQRAAERAQKAGAAE